VHGSRGVFGGGGGGGNGTRGIVGDEGLLSWTDEPSIIHWFTRLAGQGTACPVPHPVHWQHGYLTRRTLRDFWGLSAQAHADQKQKTTASPVCCGRTTTESHDCSLSAMARTTLREMGDIGISNVCCRSGWHASTDPGRVKQWTTPSG